MSIVERHAMTTTRNDFTVNKKCTVLLNWLDDNEPILLSVTFKNRHMSPTVRPNELKIVIYIYIHTCEMVSERFYGVYLSRSGVHMSKISIKFLPKVRTKRKSHSKFQARNPSHVRPFTVSMGSHGGVSIIGWVGGPMIRKALFQYWQWNHQLSLQEIALHFISNKHIRNHQYGAYAAWPNVQKTA